MKTFDSSPGRELASSQAPALTDSDRLFVASEALITLVIATRGLRPDAVAAIDANLMVQRAIEGALAAWAYYASEPLQEVEYWLLRGTTLDDRFAAWILRRLRVEPADMSSILALVQREIRAWVEAGPLERFWGDLHIRYGDVQALLRRSPPSNVFSAEMMRHLSASN